MCQFTIKMILYLFGMRRMLIQRMHPDSLPQYGVMTILYLIEQMVDLNNGLTEVYVK